jgi:hypothetical protein
LLLLLLLVSTAVLTGSFRLSSSRCEQAKHLHWIAATLQQQQQNKKGTGISKQ